LWVATHALNHSDHSLAIPFNQQAERAPVATPCGKDQISIGQPGCNRGTIQVPVFLSALYTKKEVDLFGFPVLDL
jgi:hypothetical protein